MCRGQRRNCTCQTEDKLNQIIIIIINITIPGQYNVVIYSGRVTEPKKLTGKIMEIS